MPPNQTINLSQPKPATKGPDMLEIFDEAAGKVVSGETKVHAGKQMRLQVRPHAPATSVHPHRKWTIGGTNCKTYKVDNTSGIRTGLETEDTFEKIEFYFTRPAPEPQVVGVIAEAHEDDKVYAGANTAVKFVVEGPMLESASGIVTTIQLLRDSEPTEGNYILTSSMTIEAKKTDSTGAFGLFTTAGSLDWTLSDAATGHIEEVGETFTNYGDTLTIPLKFAFHINPRRWNEGDACTVEMKYRIFLMSREKADPGYIWVPWAKIAFIQTAKLRFYKIGMLSMMGCEAKLADTFCEPPRPIGVPANGELALGQFSKRP